MSEIKIIDAELEYTGGNIYVYVAKIAEDRYLLLHDCNEGAEVLDVNLIEESMKRTENVWCERFIEAHRIEILDDDDFEIWNEVLRFIIKKYPYLKEDMECRFENREEN